MKRFRSTYYVWCENEACTDIGQHYEAIVTDVDSPDGSKGPLVIRVSNLPCPTCGSRRSAAWKTMEHA